MGSTWQLLLITDRSCAHGETGDGTPVGAIGHEAALAFIGMQAGRLCGPAQYHMAEIYQSNSYAVAKEHVFSHRDTCPWL